MAWKFAFSTLGMPGAPLKDVVDLGVTNGCDGVELRVHPEEFLHLDLSEQEMANIGEEIRQAGLDIAAVAGYAKVCAPGDDEAVISELLALITLAARIGAEGIRVFPGGEPGDDAGAQARIRAVLPQLRSTGVRLLIETHDSHPTGRETLRLVEKIGDPQHAAVLWDGLHPWRSGEDPVKTMRMLGHYFAYFQVKDAVESAQGWIPVLPGAGQVPLEQQAQLLQSWSGWVSLEWERAWHPQIEPLAEALPAAADWFRRWNPSGDH